jgi:hypothetical protein
VLGNEIFWPGVTTELAFDAAPARIIIDAPTGIGLRMITKPDLSR